MLGADRRLDVSPFLPHDLVCYERLTDKWEAELACLLLSNRLLTRFALRQCHDGQVNPGRLGRRV